jgi:hypothetical protein
MKKNFLILLLLTLLTACTIPVDEPLLPTAIPTNTSQPTSISPATFTPIPTLTQTLSPTQTSFPTSPPDFCADVRGSDLIKTFSKTIADEDGELLASLVSPSHGIDVLYYRDGNVINYDVEHAEFVFETTFQADWGLSFGSGEPTLGSFQEIILPSLQKAFTVTSVIVCNQLQVGGATYIPEWPYPYMNYYSVHFPGTAEFGGLDWETWGIGMDNIAGKPYLAALVHYVWEP